MIFRLFFITLLSITNAFASPNIVVSIKPIHSIVSLLTQGVTTPSLLLDSQQSAPYFHLKPSQLSLLDKADLVISIHPNFETGLVKVLSGIDNNKQLVVNDNDITNHHTWLDISRMQRFSEMLVERLAQIDIDNAATYQKNLILLNQKLDQLKHSISQQLSKHGTTQIAAFSNTFEYFSKANNLQKPTIVTQLHGDRLSIQKILKAKNTMQKQQTKCLLSTTEIPRKRINVLTEGLDINTVSIDIMGYPLDKGTLHYFNLIQNITNKVDQCLK